MSSPEWECEPHTRAKHALLRQYVNAWLPILAHEAAKRTPGEEIVLIDGFAGPGGYSTGEPGSPIIMLNALLGRKETDAWSSLRFRFLFIDQDAASVAALHRRVEQLGPLPGNVTVDLRRGRWEDEIAAEIERRRQASMQPPTFAFIDPFGYSQAAMDLTGTLMLDPRIDTLTFLPLTFVARFVGRAGQEHAMDNLFGCADWRAAAGLEGEARTDHLVELFKRQLAGSQRRAHTLAFRLRTLDGNDYRLFFSTRHIRGVERMKDAMWKVDPQSGVAFVADPRAGQPTLFDLDHKPDFEELGNLVRARFAAASISIDGIEDFVTLDTAFRKQHVRTALKPLITSGAITAIERPPGKKAGFPSGTLVRFA